MKDLFLKNRITIIAVAVFVVLGCAYCLPSLQGKVVLAGDTVSGQAAGNELAEYHARTGDYSFWTGSQFSGMPSYQVGGYHYKSDTLLKPLKTVLLCGWNHTPLILITYFICFFIFLRCFGADERISLAGALAIGFSSYFLTIIPAGHLYKTASIPLLCVMAGGFKLIFDRRYALGAIFTAVPTAACFMIHPQMSYYICMMVGVFFLAEAYIHIKERRWKDLGAGCLVFAAALLLGIGANSSSVFANREYASQTMRGGHSDLVTETSPSAEKNRGLDIEYATQWSYGWDESLSFLVPGIKGGSSSYDVGTDSELYRTMTAAGIDRRSGAEFCRNTPLYWGEQPFTAGNVYMGAVVCFLFVLGLILVKGPYKWAIAAATLFSVLLALGSNFLPLTEFFFNHFPLYNKFRAVSSILIVAEITMPLLGFLALRDIFSGKISEKKAVCGIRVSACITGGICLLLALLGGVLFDFRSAADAAWSSRIPDFIYDGILDERARLLRSDAWRSLLFILLSAAVLRMYVKGSLKKGVFVTLLCILIVADLWPVNRRYFNDSDFITRTNNSRQFAMTDWERQILADPDIHYRVLNLTSDTFNDARTSYYLKHIGGYSAAKLRRYQDLIEQHISRNNMAVINMLNTKYIIVPGKDGQPTPTLNPDAFGNAWFVDRVEVAANAVDECAALSTLDLRHEAVTGPEYAGFAGKASADSTASIELVSYSPKTLEYKSHSEKDGTVVFSEIHYPFGWKVTVDGKSAEHFRADYTLRAMNLPAGDHEIVFTFAPDSVKKGDTLGIVCILLIYGGTAGAAAVGIRRQRKSKKENRNSLKSQ